MCDPKYLSLSLSFVVDGPGLLDVTGMLAGR